MMVFSTDSITSVSLVINSSISTVWVEPTSVILVDSSLNLVANSYFSMTWVVTSDVEDEVVVVEDAPPILPLMVTEVTVPG